MFSIPSRRNGSRWKGKRVGAQDNRRSGILRKWIRLFKRRKVLITTLHQNRPLKKITTCRIITRSVNWPDAVGRAVKWDCLPGYVKLAFANSKTTSFGKKTVGGFLRKHLTITTWNESVGGKWIEIKEYLQFKRVIFRANPHRDFQWLFCTDNVAECMCRFGIQRIFMLKIISRSLVFLIKSPQPCNGRRWLKITFPNSFTTSWLDQFQLISRVLTLTNLSKNWQKYLDAPFESGTTACSRPSKIPLRNWSPRHQLLLQGDVKKAESLAPIYLSHLPSSCHDRKSCPA